MEQSRELIHERSEQMWARICSEVTEGDELFCLYFLPTRFKNFTTEKTPRKRQEYFGPTSTVSDKNKKLEMIWDEELTLVLGNDVRKITRRGNYYAHLTMKGVLMELNGRCTEIGYNPHLSFCEENENEL